VSDTFASKPGGGAWTLVDVQNMEVRIQNSQPRDMRCTQLDVVVNYTTSLVTSNIAFAILTPPTNGLLGVLNTNTGAVTYTPNTNYSGLDSFAFTATSAGTVSTGLVLISIKPVNRPPVFAATPADVTIPELTLLTVTNRATDADLPAQTLAYTLVNPPGNATISSNGVITWTPGEAEGPGTNQLVSVVSDGLVSVTNSFQVIVTEANVAPAFVVTPPDVTIPKLTLLTVTNNATDGDLPAQTLAYTLVDAPGNATISSNGVITWTPSEAQSDSTNQFLTVVSDGLASVTNSFTVTVSAATNATPFEIAAIVVADGQAAIT